MRFKLQIVKFCIFKQWLSEHAVLPSMVTKQSATHALLREAACGLVQLLGSWILPKAQHGTAHIHRKESKGPQVSNGSARPIN